MKELKIIAISAIIPAIIFSTAFLANSAVLFAGGWAPISFTCLAIFAVSVVVLERRWR